MATQTPQRQPREPLQASVEKSSPGAASSGEDEAVVLLPRGIADLPVELRSKFEEKARWIAQANRPSGNSPLPAPALPTSTRGNVPAPALAPAPQRTPAASPASAEEATPSIRELLRRRRPAEEGAPASEARARKATRRSPAEPELKLPALPMQESPPRRTSAAAETAEAAESTALASELAKAKKAAEKSSAALSELRKERDQLLKSNRSLERRLRFLEAASARRALATGSKAVAKAAAGAKRRHVLSLRTAPREVKIRIKALKTEAKHLRKYGVTISIQQPQGMATWTAAVQGARKELGVKGFKPAKKGSQLYRKAKEIAAKLAKRRRAQAKQAARA